MTSKGRGVGYLAQGRGMRVTPSPLGKGLRTVEPKNSTPKPKHHPCLCELSASGRSPEPHPPCLSRAPVPQTLTTAARLPVPIFALRLLHFFAPAKLSLGRRPHPAESSHARTCSPPWVSTENPGKGHGQRHVRFLLNRIAQLVTVVAATQAAAETRAAGLGSRPAPQRLLARALNSKRRAYSLLAIMVAPGTRGAHSVSDNTISTPAPP
ncbi:uncharacterized protein LOC143644704 [Tamandua tetradactyla]|uniref:uncharacterized protein LOC143644704 n=1 Tax=Tamandua tetradactyla TaxID=48850 RepID=UPI004053C77F